MKVVEADSDLDPLRRDNGHEKADMKGFRILQRLRAIWMPTCLPAADLAVKLVYPRGHRIRRDVVTAICQNRLSILRLMTRGDCEVVSYTREQWHDYVIETAASQGARVIRLRRNEAARWAETGNETVAALTDLTTSKGPVTR